MGFSWGVAAGIAALATNFRGQVRRALGPALGGLTYLGFFKP